MADQGLESWKVQEVGEEKQFNTALIRDKTESPFMVCSAQSTIKIQYVSSAP